MKIEQRIAEAMEAYNALPPDQQEAMHKAQRESWIRAMAPCEHGDPDWETCPQCRAQPSPGADQ